MKITLFAAGSRGDIQPCVVLSTGLQQAGYRVSLAAPEDFADFSTRHGVAFRPLRGDVQKIMASDTGRGLMESGSANPLKSIRAFRTMLAPVVRQMADDAFAACGDADAVICLGVLGTFGQTIAEALQIPLVLLEPTPLLPTRTFAAPAWPIQRGLGGLHNYLSGVAMLQVVWQWYGPFVNAFRARLGLPAYGARSFQRILQSTPLVGAYSPTIIRHPADWPATVHISGYLFLDDRADWQPSPALTAFLEAGEAPVTIGFGSMAGRSPAQLARIAVEAVVQSGRRGLLLTGWGGLQAASVPESVFVVDAAPHAWLFPRTAAVVHHGGAGTTAEGLRAGVPAVVVPFAFDQAFWGARIHALGLGPAPIPQKKLTAERLAQAIRVAVMDGGMRQRAGRCGEAIRTEDGVAGAVGVIRDYLGAPGTGDGRQEP